MAPHTGQTSSYFSGPDTNNAYRDLLAQIVNYATSISVTDAAVDMGGSGYVTGDIVEFQHVSAIHYARFVVTASAGAITALHIQNGGTFARRVASAVVGASGGSNYAVDDVIAVDDPALIAGTDYRQRAKFRVATLNGSEIATVAILEGGTSGAGSYITDPDTTDVATELISPGTGSGAVLDLTMQTAPPSSPTSGSTLTTITGSGSGGTADLTLAANGWHCLRDQHDFSYDTETDEKEVVMEGTVTGGDTPIIAFRTWSDDDGVNDRRGILFSAMEAFNPAMTLEAQQGILGQSDTPGASSGSYVSLLDEDTDFWLVVSGRRIGGCVFAEGATVDNYQSFYIGLGRPLGTATESPYPMFVGGAISGTEVDPEAGGIDSTSVSECFKNTSRTGPNFYRRPSDGTWLEVINGQGTAFPVSPAFQRVMFPVGEPAAAASSDDDYIVENGNFTFFNSIGQNDGSAATLQMRPTPDTGGDKFLVIPLTLIRCIPSTTEFDVHMELEGFFWVSATKSDGSLLTAQDTISEGVDLYRVFPSGSRVQRYSFWAMKEE